MNLKLKLGLFINFFVIMPIVILGGYQNVTTYQSLISEAKSSLSSELQKQQEDFLSFFDGASRDMKFCTQTTEVEKLLTAFDDEDDDEISYWTEALSSIFFAFAENRQIFSDIRFTSIADNRPVIRVIFNDNKATLAEPTLPPVGYKTAGSAPTFTWTTGENGSTLWLHMPIPENETVAIVSARVDLTFFYKLIQDKEIFLSLQNTTANQDTTAIIVNGQPANRQTINSWKPNHVGEAGKIIVTMNDASIQSSTNLPLIRWQPESLFSLAKVKDKSIIMAPIKKNLVEMAFISLLAILVAAAASYFFMTSQLITPLLAAVDLAGKIAAGNMTVSVQSSRKDEIGSLLNSFNEMSTKLRHTLTSVAQNSKESTVAASDLLTNVHQMSTDINNVSSQANSVAATSNQVADSLLSVSGVTLDMATNADSIASESNNISANITNVAAAAEEMSATILEISQNCSQAQNLANTAKEKGESSTQQITDLRQSSLDIGRVVEVITNIADQTKLLALNATIEAARAGEAGKGFAVVANEVKDLARQTAEATGDITQQIQQMQQKTESVVNAIEEINGINDDVSEINTSVAAAVEEQSATVNDIASTIAEAAQVSTTVSASIKELSQTINQEIVTLIDEASSNMSEISSSIQQINQDTTAAANVTSDSQDKATNLDKISAILQGEIRQFKLGTGDK